MKLLTGFELTIGGRHLLAKTALSDLTLRQFHEMSAWVTLKMESKQNPEAYHAFCYIVINIGQPSFRQPSFHSSK